MLQNLHQRNWAEGLSTGAGFGKHREQNSKTVKRMAELTENYAERCKEEEEKTVAELANSRVGKLDPKKHGMQLYFCSAADGTNVVAAFEEFDTNRSGKLDHAELRAALKSMGFETSQQQVRSSPDAALLLATTYLPRPLLLRPYFPCQPCDGPWLPWATLTMAMLAGGADAAPARRLRQRAA